MVRDPTSVRLDNDVRAFLLTRPEGQTEYLHRLIRREMQEKKSQADYQEQIHQEELQIEMSKSRIQQYEDKILAELMVASREARSKHASAVEERNKKEMEYTKRILEIEEHLMKIPEAYEHLMNRLEESEDLLLHSNNLFPFIEPYYEGKIPIGYSQVKEYWRWKKQENLREG